MTKPDEHTREADRAATDAPHAADEEPTAEEEQAAARNRMSPDTPDHYEEMADRGAGQQGEGRIP